MSVFAGPPLWGSSWGSASNLFPLPLSIADIALDGNVLDVTVENGIFDAPVTLRRGAHTTLSFDILGADLGKPYFVGKPGAFRNLSPSARIFLGTDRVVLYCDPAARIKNPVFSSRAPTGHVAVMVPPSSQSANLTQGRMRITLILDDILDGSTVALWGVTFIPALVVVE